VPVCLPRGRPRTSLVLALTPLSAGLQESAYSPASEYKWDQVNVSQFLKGRVVQSNQAEA